MKPAEYLDLAIKKQRLKSDRELSRALDLKSNNTITNMRSGKHLPSDDTMIKIAKLAGEPVDVALLRLNLWRSKTPETRQEYAALAARLTKQAGMIAIAIAAVAASPSASRASEFGFESSRPHHLLITYLLILNNYLKRIVQFRLFLTRPDTQFV